MKYGIDPQQIDEVLSQTLESIEEGRKDVFEIAENARQEYENVKAELLEVQESTREIIDEVDGLEHKNKLAKQRLATVSKNFSKYSEKGIKEAYDHASQINAKLIVMRDREKQMIKKRDELERRLIGIEKTVERAENVVSQLGVIRSYLNEGFQNLGETLENLQHKQELGLKIVKAQEEERRRVARDIHDGPAQGLANVVLRAEYCERILDADVNKVRQELNELKQMVRKGLQEVRKIIFDLRPMTLDDLGLVPALRRLVVEMTENEELEGELVVFGKEKRLPQNLEVGIFRIVQEALNNVKKHAQAKRVQIKTQFHDEKIIVNVKDDGKGFDTEGVLNYSGSKIADKGSQKSDKEHQGKKAEVNEGEIDSFGILNIKERVENLGGEFHLNSKANQGTIISIKVPIVSQDVEKGE